VFLGLSCRCIFIRTLMLLVLRSLRLIRSDDFKRKTIICLRKLDNYDLIIEDFVSKLLTDLNYDICHNVYQHSNSNTINILCSASPDDYVKKIAQHLNWHYLSSGIVDEGFVHMFGNNKIKYIQKLYPKSKYSYNYAISDSDSDLELLKLFDEYYLYRNKK